MSPDDPIRRIADWFEDVEPRTPPKEILDNVFAVTRRTGQRRGLAARVAAALRIDPSPTREGRMSQVMLVVLGAATAIALAIGAVGLYANRSGIGAPPSATASPTAPPLTASPPAATAGACTITLFHVRSDRAFSYDWTITGLVPGAELPTLEWRKADQVFWTNGPQDDPEARIGRTGVSRGGGNLPDSALPTRDGPWTVEVTEPADCDATATFDPFEFR